MDETDFSLSEYEARLARIRVAMAAQGLVALIVSDPSNMAWATGYDGWSFYVHQGVVIGPSGPPLWWGRGMDAAGARRTVWMGEEAIHGYDDSYVQNPDKHPMEVLAALIRDQGWAGGRVGVEMDNYYYSAKAHAVLADHLDLADATGLVNWQRLVKSPAEIARMRRAAGIVEAMHKRILEVAEPGLPKNRLVAEILHAGATGAGGHWGDYPAIVPMAPSGMDATAPHLTWDDRPMQRGEAHFFEIAGVYRRYHCPQSRTLFFGEPPATYRRAETAVQEATEAALARARPGNTCEDMAIAFYDTLGRHGFRKDSRTGYSIGLSYPPDWGERTLSLRRGDLTPLQPGMTLHFMPALWLDDGGIEITEPILITETGVEKLSTLPGALFIRS
ncbi:M24 family metallopeptidase [Pararhodobacter aggregans]|uniref:Ectoine hydrolase DoeA n=1 Tax=Pararhodobacter aggregans TaxID=404875 RepID=A0A2T7UXW6_9RHOB|nr:M24 family metallopeptidase [Pararhodobacter aggregans]PTX05105.1 ectoine hydrolase [Pararhodobacter aggregans]PVE49411.1 ectoine hydrolase DoeA [Pararhodobacter aggregans]